MTPGYLTKMSPGTCCLTTFCLYLIMLFCASACSHRGAYLYLIHFIISPIDGFLPYISMPTL